MGKAASGALIYVLMPSDSRSNWLFEMSVKPACRDSGFSYERADAGLFADEVEESLLADAQRRIERAYVVVTDMTAPPPALFYLTGYAYTLRKKVITIVSDRESLPADFRDRRPLTYGGREGKLTDLLEKRIRRALEPPDMAQRLRRLYQAAQGQSSERAGKSAGAPPTAGPTKVFVSYSHKDRRWLDELKNMSAPLVWNRKMELWDDTEIGPGEKWRPAIEYAIRKSKVAVLMVSDNFLASEFIVKNELPYLLRAAARGRLKLLWVLVRPCLYEETEIPAHQAAHDISKPLASLSTAKRAEALRSICQRIGEALRSGG